MDIKTKRKIRIHEYKIKFFICLFAILFASCAHKNEIKQLTLKDLQNKKIALVGLEGPKEARKLVEVALINEIIESGRFEIIDRYTVAKAKVIFPTETDWQRLGQKVKADYILSIDIREFDIAETSGFDSVIENDTLLAEEAGQNKPIQGKRYIKVRGYDGRVKLQFLFFDVAKNMITHEGIGEARQKANSRNKNFPRKMVFLETLTKQAIRDFFSRLEEN